LRYLGGITASKDYNLSWATGIPCCLEETTSKASNEFRSIAKGLEQSAESPMSGVRFVL
jgi:MinD-like ATPase involved in chromosome partitioning or flagellar assembly